MADKKRKKLADSIEVQLPGTTETVSVVRGDVPEAVWAELSQKAGHTTSNAKLSEGEDGRFTNQEVAQLALDPSSKPGLFDKRMQQMLSQFKDPTAREDEIRAQLKARGFDVESNSTGMKPAGQGSPSEWKDMPKEQPSSGGPGMSVRGQMQDLAKGAAPNARSGKPEQRSRVMPELDLRENPGTTTLPEVDGQAIATEERLKNAVKENEAAAQMKEGLDFTTPESNLAAAVKQRNQQPPSYQEVTDNNDTSVAPIVTDNNDTSVTPVPTRPMLVNSSTLVDPEMPAEPGLLDRAASAIGGLPETLGRVFGGGGSTAPSEADPVDTGDTTGFAPAQAPVGAPPPGAAPGGAVPSGNVSMGMKSRPGVAAPPAQLNGVDAALANHRALMEGSATLAADAEAKKADIERQRLIQQKSLQEQALKDAHGLEEQRAAASAAYAKTLTDGQAALSDLTTQRRQLLDQKVDPDRYWNDAGAGRKALSLLAAGLYGWAGQGMDYLKHLQGLVDRDVKLQQDELKRRGGVYDDLVGDQRNIIALAKEKGMSDLASVEAARVARYQELQDQLGILASDAGIQAQNPNLATMLSGLAAKKAESEMNLAKFMQQKANQEAQVAQGWAQLRQSQQEMMLKLGGPGGGGKGQQLKPQQTARLAEIFNSSKQMSDLAKNYREKIATGIGSSMTGITQYAPGGSTDAAKWAQATRGYAKSIGRGIEGGKLTDKDEESILESFIPKAGDTQGAAQEKMKRLAQYAADKYRSELEALGAGDYRSQGLPSPEQFEAHLLQQMDLVPAEPLPGETPRQ